jgi:hypothetical protein
MIVTNVVKRPYVVRVFEMKKRKRGQQLEQFIVEAESSESAKLKAESTVKDRIRRLSLHDGDIIIDVMPCDDLK